jgi:hypothetical protein
MQCPLPPVRIYPLRGGARVVVPGTAPRTTAPLHSHLPRRVAIHFASPSRHQTRTRIPYPILKPGTTKRAPPVGEMPIRAFCQLRPIRRLVRFVHPPQSILPFSKSLGGARVVVPGTAPRTTAPLHSHLPRRVAIHFASPFTSHRHLGTKHARAFFIRSSNRARRSVPLQLGKCRFARFVSCARFADSCDSFIRLNPSYHFPSPLEGHASSCPGPPPAQQRHSIRIRIVVTHDCL